MTLLKNFQTEFTNIFNSFKQAVTIKVVTRTKDSEGNETTSTSDTNTYAMVEHITEDLEYQKFGNLENADVVIILRPSETINESDLVTISSVNYKVTNITNVGIAGTTIYKECALKKND